MSDEFEDRAEVQITVRLPGTRTASGEPETFGHVTLINAEDIRMADPERHLPHSIERVARALELSLRIR